ncbi:MAG: DNA-protecting protein DprA [Bdellovibrionales bacterium]|nr:DNA-protecting protein DprA [Bdellovibrionales bacterium]
MTPEKLSCLCQWLKLDHQRFLELLGHSEPEIWRSLREHGELLEDVDLREQQKQLSLIFQEASQFQILYPGHGDYPEGLMHIATPPVFLNATGSLAGLKYSKKLAVVGARDAEFRHLEWMDEHLGFFCEKVEGCLISGGARGVDQKSTHIAEKYNYPHIIFMPSGLGVPYPKEMASYRNHKTVGMLSEYFPYQDMHRSHFVQRNRLISGVSRGVLIVQASLKSGTMITAQYAIEQNKEVATIPDFPGNMRSSGNLALLREGAHLILNGEDLVRLIH